MSKKTISLPKEIAEANILILGAGREGISTLEFLRHHLGKEKTIYLADSSPLNLLPQKLQELIYQDPNLNILLGENYLDIIDQNTQINLIFKSPGIPPTIPILVEAKAKGIIIHSQTKLFFDLCPAKIIGITGTKGKSTTASVIYHVLHTNQLPAIILGNIGIPPLSQLDEINADNIVVMELSSHQLSDLDKSPHIAVIQDIQPEHLDYYQDFNTYVNAKANIASHQKDDDYIIYNPDFRQTRKIATQSPAKRLTFSLHANGQTDLYFEKGWGIFFSKNIPRPHHLPSTPHPANNTTQPISLNLQKIKLSGKHNLLNIAPAILLGLHYGLKKEQIETALNSFTPLHHRLEYIATINQISYYNDSMGTMPDATMAALDNFPDNSVILIAGGSEKNSNYEQLAQYILERGVKHLILFPPTGDRIANEILNLTKSGKYKPPQITHLVTMNDAVQTATAAAHPGDTVLLSPASASFGLFKDYADRGDQFTQAVQNLI